MNLRRLIWWHIHDWGNWSSPVEAEFSGLLGTFDALIQIRKCSKCGAIEHRRI